MMSDESTTKEPEQEMMEVEEKPDCCNGCKQLQSDVAESISVVMERMDLIQNRLDQLLSQNELTKGLSSSSGSLVTPAPPKQLDQISSQSAVMNGASSASRPLPDFSNFVNVIPSPDIMMQMMSSAQQQQYQTPPEPKSIKMEPVPEQYESMLAHTQQALDTLAAPFTTTGSMIPNKQQSPSTPTAAVQQVVTAVAPRSEPSTVDESSTDPKRCSNCNTDSTTVWKRDAEGKPVCNPCGLYYRLHRVNRPRSSMIRSTPVATAPSVAAAGVQQVVKAVAPPSGSESSIVNARCPNCNTDKSTAWRKIAEGIVRCSACGLFYRLNKVNRPLQPRSSMIPSTRVATAPSVAAAGAQQVVKLVAIPSRSGSSIVDAHCSSCNNGNLTARRKSVEGIVRCKACGYYRLNNVNRPLGPRIFMIRSTPTSGVQQVVKAVAPPSRSESSIVNARCPNCNTDKSTAWRKIAEGIVRCSACGLFYRLHKVNRPIDDGRRMMPSDKTHVQEQQVDVMMGNVELKQDKPDDQVENAKGEAEGAEGAEGDVEDNEWVMVDQSSE